MTAQLIDGRAVAARIKNYLKTQVAELSAAGHQPGLAVVLVGSDPASRTYVNMKQKACAELGIYSEEHALPAPTSQAELLRLVATLNKNPKIHGILVQLPLPEPLAEAEVIAAIDPAKDVDGLHPVSLGNLLIGAPGFVSCTPAGIMELIRETGVVIKGKECVVVGRSNIVGKPLAVLLLREHGTVTICHSRTANLEEVCRRADILVAAVGKIGLIKGSMVKPGAVVIDVGTNHNAAGKLVGDVEFETAAAVAGWITPVPGGVGPMTIAMLLKNTVLAASRSAC